jgi:arabinofuranosyltransferase
MHALMSDSKRRFFAVFLLVFAVALIVGASLDSFTVYDDAYITYRYARNLAEGNGPVWNVGEPVEGYTSPAHMFLMAGVIKLGLDPGLTSQFLSLLALALIAALGFRRYYRDDKPFGKVIAVAWASYCATSPAFLWSVYSGLETTLFAGVVFVTLLALETDLEENRLPIASGLLTLASALTRPEGVIVGIAAGLAILLMAKTGRIVKAAVFSILAGGPYVLFIAWRLSFYGYLYPNTYYTKVGSLSLALAKHGVSYVLQNAALFVIPLVVLGLFLGLRKQLRTLGVGPKIHLLVLTLMAVQVTMSGGDFLPFGRFLVPVLPSMMLAFVALLEMALKRSSLDFPEPGRKTWRGLAFVLIALQFCNPLMWVDNFRRAGNVALTEAWLEKGAILAATTPADAVLSVGGIGAIGWASKRTLIDFLGLTDSTIAHTEIETGKGYRGHEKHNAPYLLRRAPDLILICSKVKPEPSLECHCGRGIKGAGQLPAIRELYKEPLFKNRYEYSNCQHEDQYVSAYLRKDHRNQPGYECWKSASDAGQECPPEQDAIFEMNPGQKLRYYLQQMNKPRQPGDPEPVLPFPFEP